MINKFKKDLKLKGFISPKVKYYRHDTHSISYDVYLNESDKKPCWDGGYFVSEENSANSKESMIKDWDNFVNNLTPF